MHKQPVHTCRNPDDRAALVAINITAEVGVDLLDHLIHPAKLQVVSIEKPCAGWASYTGWPPGEEFRHVKRTAIDGRGMVH